jgi:ATP-dependent DNA ligase
LSNRSRRRDWDGLVAKRRDSVYEPGRRSGAWRKMRVNQGQELVIGGYTVGGSTFDALVFGYYDGKNLIYAARTRDGFTPKLRADLMKRLRPLETPDCPFSNLPEAKGGRWGPSWWGSLSMWSGHPITTFAVQNSSASGRQKTMRWFAKLSETTYSN